MTNLITIFAKNTLAKEFEEHKFFKGDNFYKVAIFYKDKECTIPLFSQKGAFRKNQTKTTFNCFNYNVILTNN